MGPSATIQDEHLVFSQTVEALFVHGVGARLGDPTRARLKQAGLDLARPLLPAYPIAVFARGVAILAEDIYPALTSRDAYQLLGQRTVLGMDETLVGRANMALARLVGPLRSLMAVPKNVKAGSTRTRAAVNVMKPTQVELEMVSYALPYAEFQVGTVEGIFQFLRRAPPRCEVLAFDPRRETVKLRISWD